MVEEYKLKIPKPKDLPPSWFELVLRPERFQKHLETLQSNPYAEPSALVLLTTFLEKAGVIEGLQTSNEASSVSGGRKQVLVDCALFLAAFLKWDLNVFENCLPSAVTYSLLLSLKEKFPRQASSSSLIDESRLTIIAHIFYCWWIIRVLARGNLPVHPPQGLLWDGTCATHDSIEQLLSPYLDEAVQLLSGIVSEYQEHSLPLPCVELCLPCGDSDDVCLTLPHEVTSMDRNALSAQLTFDLGKTMFDRENYSRAHEFFLMCNTLLNDLRPSSINRSKLKGYLSACSSMLDMQGEEQSMSICEIEKRRGAAMKDVPPLLPLSHVFSEAYRTGLEVQATLNERQEQDDDKMEVEEVTMETGVKASTQICLWSAVQSVMEGGVVRSGVLQLLHGNSSNADDAFEYLLQVVKQVQVKGENEKWKRLAVLVKSVCGCNKEWREKVKELGLKQLLSPEDSTPLSAQFIFINQQKPSALHNSILTADSANQVIDRVSELYQHTPSPEHSALAAKWQGGKPWFASPEQIPDPLVQTQYNALLHRAAIFTQSKDYSSAVVYCSSALKLIASSSRNKLLSTLGEHVLELSMQSTGMGPGKFTIDEVVQKHASLIEDVKRYYSRPQTSNTSMSTFTMAAVFLLNLQQYRFVEREHHSTQHEQVCSRLASAAQCVRENRDTRKCTRDLFETVSSIFITPPNNSEGRALHRKSLEFISTNLQDEVSISYLLCALTRLWTMLTKPDFEVYLELGTHWPTAVGSASTINTSYVLCVLDSTLNHALLLYPRKVSWLILRADLRGAVGSYGAALMSYLEAGALKSDFFEISPLTSVWSQQVIRKMINCCCKLDYHSHAIILCQLLSPVDYQFTFSLLKERIQEMLNSMFTHLWDMTIIEYLIYTVAKQKDTIKQTAAVQVAGQPELNTNNSRDVLDRAVEVRKRRFLRQFYRTVSAAVQ